MEREETQLKVQVCVAAGGGASTYGQTASGVGQAWDLPYLAGAPEPQFLHL